MVSPERLAGAGRRQSDRPGATEHHPPSLRPSYWSQPPPPPPIRRPNPHRWVRAATAAYLTYYAQMTGQRSSATLECVEIRDSPLHRSFQDPSQNRVRRRTARMIAGNCTTPVFLPHSTTVDDMSNFEQHRDHEIGVRCRNCPSCLRARRFQWAMRAHWEILHAPKTWFFTGTHRDQGHDYNPAKEEVQRFVKRLREREKAYTGRRSLRYLMLPELHKSGAIHWHGLLHHDGGITYRMVRSAWSAGYSFPSTVKKAQGCANYVTKYATKDMLGASMGDDGRNRRPRILASRSPTYGDPVIIRDPELIQELARANQEELHETWRKNLLQAIRNLEASKTEPGVHRRLQEQLAAEGLTLS